MRGPPRPGLCLNIGITGHRANALPDEVMEQLEPVLTSIFGMLREAAITLKREEPEIFSEDDVVLRLHTPLATGADQIGFRAARMAGYKARALLPLHPDVYRDDFAEGEEREAFDQLLENADSCFALPGDPVNRNNAYYMVGQSVVAASDILIAIWDGHEAKGPGGTAQVVDLALAARVPVIHVSVSRKTHSLGQARLLEGRRGARNRPVLRTPEEYDALVRRVLMVPGGEQRKGYLQFLSEHEDHLNTRLAYPLMLAMLGVRKFSSGDWRHQNVEDNARMELGDAIFEGHSVLPKAFGWANILAVRYAQKFRSGHVLNYVLSAVAVLVALSGLLLPDLKLYLVICELAVIGLLFGNTWAGTRGDWHRRWLQYRYLAEALRTLPYLKDTGLAPPPFRTKSTGRPLDHGTTADWTWWYADMIWRNMPNPKGNIGQAYIEQLRDGVLEAQIRPQSRYHHSNVHRMHHLDHRLHALGQVAMMAVILACGIFVGVYFTFNDWAKANAGIFVFVTAGLPAVGAALFGLRGHGEHLLAASRSHASAARLEAIEAAIEQTDQLDELTAELEDVARTMLADLDEWTLAYRERSLQIPA